METKLLVTPAPHVRSAETTKSIMCDVAIALIPAAAFAVYNFGLYALMIILVSVFFAVAAEYYYNLFLNKPQTASDGSALVTGLIFALNMTPNVPMWVVISGSVLSVVVFKLIFGGLGKNIVNPALGGRIVMFLLSYFFAVGGMLNYGTDALSGSTPLVLLKRGMAVGAAGSIVGNIGGCLGEVSALAILIGFAYLLIKQVISWEIPVLYVASFAVYMVIFRLFSAEPLSVLFILTHICSGGLLFGAVFMATDYVTAPTSFLGKVIYAVLLGLMTGLFRTVLGSFVEGVSFAILIGNLLARWIDKLTIPKSFGTKAQKLI